jgi:hypothetical protein
VAVCAALEPGSIFTARTDFPFGQSGRLGHSNWQGPQLLMGCADLFGIEQGWGEMSRRGIMPAEEEEKKRKKKKRMDEDEDGSGRMTGRNNLYSKAEIRHQ